jgi:hypothetical protein
MTQDEIIEMAKEARIHRDDSWRFEMLQEKNALEAFAKLVAAKEREACAKLCDDFSAHYWAKNDAHESVIYEECAAAIRARGQA